jgi:hypothetical protein
MQVVCVLKFPTHWWPSESDFAVGKKRRGVFFGKQEHDRPKMTIEFDVRQHLLQHPATRLGILLFTTPPRLEARTIEHVSQTELSRRFLENPLLPVSGPPMSPVSSKPIEPSSTSHSSPLTTSPQPATFAIPSPTSPYPPVSLVAPVEGSLACCKSFERRIPMACCLDRLQSDETMHENADDDDDADDDVVMSLSL